MKKHQVEEIFAIKATYGINFSGIRRRGMAYHFPNDGNDLAFSSLGDACYKASGNHIARQMQEGIHDARA